MVFLNSIGSIFFRQIAGYLGHLQVSFSFSLILSKSDVELFDLIVGKNPDYAVESHFSAIEILQNCQFSPHSEENTQIPIGNWLKL